MSSPRRTQTADLACSCRPAASSVTLRGGKHRHGAQFKAAAVSHDEITRCRCCLQAGSDTAVCEDLRELREEAEGVRLWLKRSRASFRLDVFSWDSEPESWDCCERQNLCQI